MRAHVPSRVAGQEKEERGTAGSDDQGDDCWRPRSQTNKAAAEGKGAKSGRGFVQSGRVARQVGNIPKSTGDRRQK
jgi:hypothetical protein